jgi:hypothetical protein
MNAPETWSSILRRRTHLLLQQIVSLQRLAQESGAAPEKIERYCAPYYEMLDAIYENDLPVARALDGSDLLLHLDGEGLQTRSPRVSLVTGIMGDVRKQVGAVIRTLVSSFSETVELPREFELGLSSFAHGSLYLGFSLPQPGAGYATLPDDPFVAASRQALSTFGAITEYFDRPDAYDSIRRDFADPKLRDAALSAVGHLAPSGRRGVSSVAIGGRALPGRAWQRLTPETRLQVKAWLEQPVLSDETIELTGRVRAIDLDLRRFDLRRIGEGTLPDLRCIYAAAFDPPARAWLDRTVRVRGRVETYQGVARLLQIESVTEIPAG